MFKVKSLNVKIYITYSKEGDTGGYGSQMADFVDNSFLFSVKIRKMSMANIIRDPAPCAGATGVGAKSYDISSLGER